MLRCHILVVPHFSVLANGEICKILLTTVYIELYVVLHKKIKNVHANLGERRICSKSGGQVGQVSVAKHQKFQF